MVVVGAGTGGTVAGIGRKFKEKMPNVQVWGRGEEGRGRRRERRRRGGREEKGGGREGGREKEGEGG